MLSSLDEGERRQVLASSRRRSFARGETIFHEGDPADSLHLLASGRLAVRVSTPSGDSATLNVLSPGDFFGELSLVRREGEQHRSATVIALEPAETLVLTTTQFRRLCGTHPRVEHLLVSLLARRVEQLSGHLLEALYVGLDRRVYRCLLELARVYGEGEPAEHTVIPLTQEHLADLAGGTRPSVNQILQKLAAQGTIGLGRGKLTIIDRSALKRRAAL